ncbi:MAG: DUF6273 domain-containing protein [Oscillospiraceae bacterium]|nr:DUF6273 domain-containing protein [Oscillospiraceae bacterium]
MKKLISFLLLAAMMFSLTATAGAAGTTNLSVGSKFLYGTYEQDGDTSNGAEPIEWVVLRKSGNQALVISDCILDAVTYQPDYTNVTWETCALREWMNNTFLNTAFTEEEQAAIVPTTLDNSNESNSSTMWISLKAGNETTDKIFALSCQEAEGIFGNRKGNKVTVLMGNALSYPTAYAESKGITPDNKDYGYWWLRSPGVTSFFAAYVSSLSSEGITYWFSPNIGARPAMWIDLEAAGGVQYAGSASNTSGDTGSELIQLEAEAICDVFGRLSNIAAANATTTDQMNFINNIIDNYNSRNSSTRYAVTQLSNGAFRTADMLYVIAVELGQSSTGSKAGNLRDAMYDSVSGITDPATVTSIGLFFSGELLYLIAKDNSPNTQTTAQIDKVLEYLESGETGSVNIYHRQARAANAMAMFLAIICGEFDSAGTYSDFIDEAWDKLSSEDDAAKITDQQVVNALNRSMELAQILAIEIGG